MKKTHAVDIVCDVRNLSIIPSNCIDEILSVHCCEHFYITEIVDILKEWHRVLRDGGMIVCELPCWDKVKIHIANDGPENMTRWPLYGEPRTHVDGEPALHKYCYSQAEFVFLLASAGFKEIETKKPLFHVPSRDMRIVAYK